MKKLLLTISFLLLALPSWATTYYVRTNGSNSTNCTGTTNVDYPGSGTGVACAFNHPFYAYGWCGDYPNSCTAGAMSGGDDLVIVNGSYNVGYSSSWAGCSVSWSYGCNSQTLPSGTSGNHTSITGCTTTGCASLANRPKLYGHGRNQHIFNLSSATYIDIKDLELTDTGDCGYGHALYGCATYDDSNNSCNYGIVLTGSGYITLTNLNIHGLRLYGLYGANSGGPITITGCDISYNSYAGWDQDTCGNAGTCGTNYDTTITNTNVEFNGCVESSSSPGTIMSKGCYGGSQSGYGDGFGTSDTGGNWTVTGSNFSHNVSDGLDLLYHNRSDRQSYTVGTTTVLRSRFEGNSGNQLKSDNHLYVEDSILIGNCGFFYGKSYACDAGTCGNAFEDCRANTGSPISIRWQDTTTPKIYSNTILSNADVGILTSGACTASTPVYVENNILLGGRQFNDDVNINVNGGNDSSSVFFNAGSDGNGTGCTATFTEDYNICYLWKEGSNACNGAHSLDTSDPLFSGTIKQGPYNSPGYYTDTNYYAQLYLAAGSPARGVSDTTLSGADATDYNSYARGAAWDAGALEYGSTPAGGGATCGNNLKESGETCDGTDLDNQSCVTQGYNAGTLSCAGDCLSFVVTGCTNAGRGTASGRTDASRSDAGNRGYATNRGFAGN